MKFLQASVMLIVLAGTTQSFAKIEQCRFIDAKPDREACYDRQAKALAAKKAEAAAKPATTDPLERMKQDDEALSRRLRSICRGC
jgi:cell division protein FtsI/penicillin-binding protein 2